MMIIFFSTKIFGDRSSTVVKEFFINIKSFQWHYGPGVDSASNRYEYQEHFLRVKAVSA